MALLKLRSEFLKASYFSGIKSKNSFWVNKIHRRSG